VDFVEGVTPMRGWIVLQGIALFAAVAGMIVQIIAGVDYPAVPPGPIILGVVGIALFATFNRWVALAGVAAPLFIVVGGAVEGSSWGRLAHPGEFGPFLGTALQWIGLVGAIAFGLRAVLLGRSVSATGAA
jgi:hypothetical protein